MPTIRRIREQEIPRLVDDLWRPFAEEMADLDAYNELADDIRQDAFEYRRETFEDESIATFVAADDGELLGYAVVTRKESPPVFARGPTGHVEELYVVPSAREHGLGSALLERAETWADERDCERVTLGVNADNTTAQALYEAEGYAIMRHKMHKRLE